MGLDKHPLKELVGKLVVTKEGKRLGIVKDITFETKTGELIQLVVRDPTPHIRNLNVKCTFYPKKKVVVIVHSLLDIVRNFTSEQQMLLVT